MAAPALPFSDFLTLRGSEDLANTIAQQFIAYVDANFGEAGECDLRDFANAVFWPMTVALFGKNAGKDAAPDLCVLLPTSWWLPNG